MKRMRRIRLLFLLFVVPFLAKASYQSEIYNAYIHSDLVQWKKVLDEMEMQENKSDAFLLELLNYQYGYVAWHIGNNKAAEAEKYIESGRRIIKTLESRGYRISSVNSYKAAFYAFRMVINKFEAPFIAFRCIDCAKVAIRQDAKNPCGYIQYGNTQYFMPSIFGGSKTAALEYYKNAERLMEQNPELLKEDWNYLNLLTIIALTYKELKQFEASKSYYEKILRIEPDYKWVKEDLYPELLKKFLTH